MKEVYAIEIGEVKLEAKTGMPIFECQALSQEVYENINDAIDWIETRYGSPRRVGNTTIWQSQGTDHAYCIKFLTVVVNKRG